MPRYAVLRNGKIVVRALPTPVVAQRVANGHFGRAGGKVIIDPRSIQR